METWAGANDVNDLESQENQNAKDTSNGGKISQSQDQGIEPVDPKADAALEGALEREDYAGRRGGEKANGFSLLTRRAQAH
jgi:hypothetical protein